MGKAQGRTLREVDEQVIAAKRLYSWDLQDGIKARGDNRHNQTKTMQTSQTICNSITSYLQIKV